MRPSPGTTPVDETSNNASTDGSSDVGGSRQSPANDGGSTVKALQGIEDPSPASTTRIMTFSTTWKQRKDIDDSRVVRLKKSLSRSGNDLRTIRGSVSGYWHPRTISSARGWRSFSTCRGGFTRAKVVKATTINLSTCSRAPITS